MLTVLQSNGHVAVVWPQAPGCWRFEIHGPSVLLTDIDFTHANPPYANRESAKADAVVALKRFE